MGEPLTGQMADFLGVPNGLMVKTVAPKSEAGHAGLKARDVILKVGPDAITTMSDWDRAMRQNQGKTVQVTILRDRKQQTLTLQVDSKRKTSELDMKELFPSGDCSLMAELNPDMAQIFNDGDQAAKTLQDQAETLKDQLKIDSFKVDPQQAEEMRKAAEALKDQLKMDTFKVDPKQMEDLKQQMQQWQKDYNPDTFKVDQKQLDDLKKQMEQWQKDYNPDTFKFDQKQSDDLKRQMEQFRMDYSAPDQLIGPN